MTQVPYKTNLLHQLLMNYVVYLKHMMHQMKRVVLKEGSSPPLNVMEGTQLVCIKVTVNAEYWSMCTLGAPKYTIFSAPYADT